MGQTTVGIVLLALILPSCFCLQFGTALDTITPSKSIKDPEVIISKNGVFLLGFFNFANSTHRYVGIWYNHIPVQTVVWVANRNKPLKDSSGVVKISEDGNLVVLNGQEEILWSSNVTNLISNTSALLLDSGNLVLKNDDDDNGGSIWESFQHPSNAYTPTMKISTDLRTGQRVQLSSWKSPSDPSDGNFSLSLEPLNIPEVIIWNNNQPYFRTGPWNGQIFIGMLHMNSVYLNGFSLVADDQKETFYLSYALANKSMLAYFELNPQGKIVEQNWDEGKGDWANNWPILENDCDVYGKCGAFGSCDSMKPSICSCLRGFEPKNREEWNRENWASGCVRTTPLGCQKVNNGSDVGKDDGFLKLEMMKVPAFAEWSSPLEETCEEQCLRNCSCVAYAYDVGIGCMLWSGNLIDIQKFPSRGVDLYIRVASSELDRKKKSKVVIITVIVGIIIITIATFFLRSWMAKHRGRKQKTKEMLPFDIGKAVAKFSSDNVVGENLFEVKLQQLPLFNFEELASATNNFHLTEKLGHGGFGPVYRGTLQDGKEIAVKRLSRASGQGLEEFMNEMVVISKLQHRNLVRLLGCCVEREEKMLVYEYMPNKSLDAFLFDQVQRQFLNWEKCFNIIEGISRGLLYLHRDSRLRIIHRDLKASNILLDQDLNPKISDFGMARIFRGNENHANTKRVMGTYGYMSPEYAMQGQFSEKSDVFSFGVLLLEIVSGRKNTSFYNNQHSFSLLGYAWKLWKEDNILGLVDIEASDPSYDEKEILRCIHVGLLCVQEFAKERPTMSRVVSMLNSEIVDLPPPKQPAFTERQINQDVESLPNNEDKFSVNDVSITDFDGR
ncbi:S-locus glycoprotein domain - like 10 [Theobroma cacao]|nr:S-locus glycoprotein domain - like 10 [Theobroma cacao]